MSLARNVFVQTFFTLGLSAMLVGEHIGWDTIAFAAAGVGLVALARKAKVQKAGQ